MVKVTPGRPRAVVTSIPGGVRVAVATRKNPFRLVFLTVWLVGWAFGEVAATTSLLRGLFGEATRQPPPTAFLLVWLAGWTLGGAFALLAFAWNAFGREVVELSGGALRVRRKALGIGRTREYDLAHVANLRVSPAPLDPFSFRGSLRFWGLGNGLVAFDYGATTVRILGGIDEAEATKLADTLGARLGAASEAR